MFSFSHSIQTHFYKYYYLSVSMRLKEGVTDETLQTEVSRFNAHAQKWLYGVNSWIGKRFLKNRSELISEKK